MKISVKRSRLNVIKFFFSQRVVSQWNSLPEDVVIAKILELRFPSPTRT